MRLLFSALIAPGIVYAFTCTSAIGSTCGRWDAVKQDREFAVEPYGTVGFVRGGRYVILPRGRCINLTDASGSLRFVINHNGAPETQPTFASIHVALVKVGGSDPQQQYLYRNGGVWAKDRSGLQYSSSHLAPHSDFDGALRGNQSDFDKQYIDDVGRTWNDTIETETMPVLRFQSWSYRSNFSTKEELAEAVKRNQISLRSQNYLVSFKSRTPAAGEGVGSLPGFNFNSSGYDCAFVRVTGTSNQPELAGEYMLNLSVNRQCESIISGFTSLNSTWSILDIFK
ncbi:hypothetical protein [Tardiphaga sp. P5_C7]